MYRQPAFQFQATNIPSSSTPPMFQARPGGFDTGIEDQLPWYEMRVDDILATMEEASSSRPTRLARHSGHSHHRF
jgi:hypothetical protein